VGGFRNDPCMQPPSVKSISWNQGMPLHATLGEVVHVFKSVLLGLGGNRSTQLQMQEAAQLLE